MCRFLKSALSGGRDFRIPGLQNTGGYGYYTPFFGQIRINLGPSFYTKA